MGKRISSIVIVLSWKSNFTPRLSMVCLPTMRSCIGAWSPGLYVQLKVDLLADRVLHKRDYNVAHLVCDKGAIGSAPRLRDNQLHNGNAFTRPFFMKRRSPLDPESSRTLIVLFLTYSPELTLGSGVLAQSEHVFLLLSIKLVQFSSNFFNLGANFCRYPAFFLNFEKGFSICGYFPLENWRFPPFGEKASHF
jgi:hypothetical protein